jgi:DNA-binding MarR family transcriptional regulator
VDYTRCINFLLTISQHEVFLIFSENLSEFGITPGQYGVLACLWKHETLTPKEIANILRVENSTISGVLDRMQKRPHPRPQQPPQHPRQTDGCRHGHQRTGPETHRRTE